jgi:L-alanine-DL-glutamate epimerase-like enolase superfamily enzyme
MALSAVDIALWDLCARLQDQPLTAVWGDPVAPVAVYASGGFTSYDDTQLRSQLAGWLSERMDKVKIKIGESWGTRVERDLDRVELARRTVGDEVALFVDANGGYTAEQACTVGHMLDGLGVVWFEEPVSSDDHEGLDTVRDRVRADVTAGEYGHDRSYFRELAPHVDCLQIDVTRCGGYTEWRRVATDPALAGVELSGHCAPYASLPVAAGTTRLRHLEWFHDHVRIEQLLFDGWTAPVRGVLRSGEAPGHGLAFRTADAQPYRVA